MGAGYGDIALRQKIGNAGMFAIRGAIDLRGELLDFARREPVDGRDVLDRNDRVSIDIGISQRDTLARANSIDLAG